MLNRAVRVMLAVPLFCIGSVSAFADGPFGVEMGSPLSNFTNCEKTDKFSIKCHSLSKAHYSFNLYSIVATEKTGVCVVVAITPSIASGSYGTELRLEADKIVRQLISVYGE